MASTKGIAVTIAILVGVVAASFLVYLIPEDTTMKIVVSDFKKHLDITKEKASMEITSIDESFEKLMEKKISPDEYINIAEVSSSQINSLIIELTSSGAAQEWYDSYANYIGALDRKSTRLNSSHALISYAVFCLKKKKKKVTKKKKTKIAGIAIYHIYSH